MERELRVASRRSSTYWLRFFAALMVLIVWIVLLVGTRRMAPAQLSLHIITMLGSLTLGFCMMAGAFLTSDCVSSEKREGTIGLLFLTDLKGYDVILGKLVAASVHAFFGLLAAIPILGLSLMMGGVTGAEFARFVLVFALTLFLSLALGIVVSTLSRRAMRASAGAFLLMAMLAGLLPALWWTQEGLFKNPVFDILLVPSPPYLFRKAYDASYALASGPREFWRSACVIFSIAIACIIVACVALPRVWRTTETHSWFRVPRWSLRRPVLRPPRVALARATNPFAWLAGRDFSARLISWRVLVPLVGFCATLLGVSLFQSKTVVPFIVCFFTAFGLHLLLKVLIAMEAGRRINEDRQSGALELLLVTALPIEAIIQGQRTVLRAHFRRPILLLACLNLFLAFAVLAFPTPLRMDGEDQIIFCELFFGGIALLIADFHALSWLGLWRGLTCQNHRAVVGTVLKVMGIPWGVIVLLISTQPNMNQTTFFFFFASWIVTGLIIDAVVVATARRKLAEHFRAAAAGEARKSRRLRFAL